MGPAYSVCFNFPHWPGPRAFTSPSKGYKRCFTDGYSAQVYPTGGSLLTFGVGYAHTQLFTCAFTPKSGISKLPQTTVRESLAAPVRPKECVSWPASTSRAGRTRVPQFPGLLCDRRSSVHPHPQPTRGTADAQAAHHRLARGYLLSGVALA